MPTELRAQLNAANTDFAIIVSRFNDLVTRRLLDGALETLARHNADAARITVAWVPGSFEIPLAANRMARSGKFHAIICLGAVIQGSTTHHEYVNSQTASGILQASISGDIPVTFGIITCESLEQALDRAGGKAGNKGQEATLAAIEMVNLLKLL